MTATPENAMTPEERDQFLARRLLTRLTTVGRDGWPHTAPAWFLWENGVFVHSLGPGRQHMRNLKYDLRVTECIDVDDRLTAGLEAGAAGVICFGTAQVVEDEQETKDLLERILLHYLGSDDGPKYLAPSLAEIPQGRRMIKVKPSRWITWDYDKVD
jgi:nitroimidazol reductase NimA-like FMN-containing flavoprotein (pyridoxamine 5'-phosphate oxidase superfamily)